MRPTLFLFTRARRRRAITLVEVMIAALVFTIVALGCLSAVIYTYKINDRTRYRDQARAVIQGVAEDFLRGPLRSKDGQQQPLYNNTNLQPTGVGIEIVSYDESQIYRANGAGVLLYPLITRSGNTINMQITRTVYNVQPSNGAPNNGSTVVNLNGRMKACRLVGTFTLHGRTETVDLTVVRTDRFD
jgi:Tfp pilus assembly protein PilV